MAGGVALTLRRADLTTASKQCLLPADTCSASDIAEGALGLLSSMHSFPAPLRALSVAATRLSESSVRQMSLFDDGVSREEVLEKCVDEIRTASTPSAAACSSATSSPKDCTETTASCPSNAERRRGSSLKTRR